MHKQFEQYQKEKIEIYDPLLSGIENHGVDYYLNLLKYFLIQRQDLIIDVGGGVDEDIAYIVNYCCYILINYINKYRYDSDAKGKYALFLNQLLAILKKARNSQIGEYLNPFFERKKTTADTDISVPSHYERIEQLVNVYQQKYKSQEIYFTGHHKTLKSTIAFFPPLYEHVLGYGTNKRFRQKIAEDKKHKVMQYTNDLYKFMRGYLSGVQEGDYNGFTIASKVAIPSISNPSRLDPEDLIKSFNFFAEGSKNNHEVTGRKFLLLNAQEIRWEVNKFIIDLLPEKYSRSFFGQRLLAKLHEIFPDNIKPAQVPDAIIKLISFLTIEADRNHYQLVNLLSNIGSKKLLNILTMLAKLYPNAGLKEAIDKRFSMLFKHYADYPESEMQWLIRLLENYNLASSILFERMDIDGLKKLIERNKKNLKN